LTSEGAFACWIRGNWSLSVSALAGVGTGVKVGIGVKVGTGVGVRAGLSNPGTWLSIQLVNCERRALTL
jgi:hypothetical protein